MVDIPGVITLYFYIWPIHYLHSRMPHYLLISLLSHPLLWSDLVLILNDTSVYMLELTVGFESKITINSNRKLAKYRPLFNSLRANCTSIKFFNLSMSASSDSLLQMLQDLHFEANVQNNIVMKASNTAIRCSNCIYCRRNKQWTYHNLLTY